MSIRIAIALICGGLPLLPAGALAAKVGTYECKATSAQCVITCFGAASNTPVFKTDRGVTSATLTTLEGNSTAFELEVTYSIGHNDVFIGTGASQCLMANFGAKH